MQSLAGLTLARLVTWRAEVAEAASAQPGSGPSAAPAPPARLVVKNPPSEILPGSYARFKLDPARYLAQSDLVWAPLEGPPANWIDGLPVGNGDFGAMVYGYPDNLSFALGKTDIWDRRDIGHSNFPAGTFAELRQTFFDRDEAAFNRFREGNGRPFASYASGVGHLTDAGVFRLRLAEDSIATGCTARLSLHDAVGRMEFLATGQNKIDSGDPSKNTVEFFASREHDVIAIRLQPGRYPLGHVSWELGRALRPECTAPTLGQEGNLAWFHQQMPAGDSFVIAAQVETPAAAWNAAGNRLVGDLLIRSQEPLEVYLTIVTSFDSPDPLAEAKRRLRNATRLKYEGLIASHRDWWRRFWERSFVSFGRQDIEKWWYVSNYLCGSILRPGKQTPGLQGVWVKENYAAWNGDYHGNVNMQALYWSLYPSNRLELTEPYFRYYTDILPQCRKDAREYFGMRGARLPHAGDTRGYEITDNWITLSTSISPSGWLANLFWKYYEYTADKEFLASVAYPLLRDVAMFYDDYLRKDAQGRYSIEPSIHGEAFCPDFKSWARNSGYEISILRVTFETALEAAEILGCDAELQASWEDKLAHLAPIPTTPDGVWKAWEDRAETYAEQCWLTFPVYPIDLVSIYHGPEALRSQAIATWKYLRENKRLPSTIFGGRGASLASRLGDPEWAVEVAGWNAKPDTKEWVPDITKCGGLTSPTHSYIQFEHGPGMSRALSDMMLLGLGGVLRVFPGVPKRIPARFHSLRAQGAFLVSAEKRGEEVDYVLVQSLAGNRLRLANPFSGPARLRSLTTGKTVAEGAWATGQVIESPTAKGEIFVLESASRPLETIPAEVLTGA
jgi:alpha-L-fucosidase 2